MMGVGATTAMAAGAGEGRERPTFQELDADGSGEITTADLDAMRTERFTEIDTDGDGSVSEAEFVAKAQADAQERAAAMFARLDADGDGVLSQDVLQSRTRGGGSERMISRLDTDDSGGVSAEEFEAGMEKMADRRKKGGGKKRGGGFGLVSSHESAGALFLFWKRHAENNVFLFPRFKRTGPGLLGFYAFAALFSLRPTHFA